MVDKRQNPFFPRARTFFFTTAARDLDLCTFVTSRRVVYFFVGRHCFRSAFQKQKIHWFGSGLESSTFVWNGGFFFHSSQRISRLVCFGCRYLILCQQPPEANFVYNTTYLYYYRRVLKLWAAGCGRVAVSLCLFEPHIEFIINWSIFFFFC